MSSVNCFSLLDAKKKQFPLQDKREGKEPTPCTITTPMSRHSNNQGHTNKSDFFSKAILLWVVYFPNKVLHNYVQHFFPSPSSKVILTLFAEFSPGELSVLWDNSKSLGRLHTKPEISLIIRYLTELGHILLLACVAPDTGHRQRTISFILSSASGSVQQCSYIKLRSNRQPAVNCFYVLSHHGCD